MPTVSIDTIAPPVRSFAQSGAAGQCDHDQPSQFASFLSAQTGNPSPAPTENNAAASSPPAQADVPSRQATNAPSSADNRQPAGIAERSSGKAKDMAKAVSAATDRPTATKAKITPQTAVATASPTPPAQTGAADVPPVEIPLVAAAATADAADEAVGTTALPVTGDTGTDKGGRADDDAHAATDAANQVAATSDPSAQNSQPGPNAALPLTAANLQAVAAVAPASTGPMASPGPNADGTGHDPLTVTGDAPVLSNAAATPVSADASGKTATPNGDGDPPRNAQAMPPTESATPTTTVRPATPPALGTEQSLTVANAGANGPAAPASSTIEPNERPRDVVKPPDSSANAGLVIQTQTASLPGAAITGSTAVSPPNQSATAPVPVSEVAVTIAAQAQSGKSRFEIRLDPPELGRIDVQLNVDSRGTVSSRLIVERLDTLNLLVRDAPQLQRALQDAGLGTAGNMQFSLADQGFANRNGFAQQNEFASPRTSGGTAGDTVPIAAPQGYAARSSRNGGLDITV